MPAATARATTYAEQYWMWKQIRQTLFESFSFYRIESELLTIGSGSERKISVVRGSSNLFETLGVTLLLRSSTFDADPELTKLILTEEVWRKQFRSDPHISGHVVRVGSQEVIVGGVAPAGT